MNDPLIRDVFGLGHGVVGWMMKLPWPSATPWSVKAQISTAAVVVVETSVTVHWSVNVPFALVKPVPFFVPSFTVLPSIVTSMWISALAAEFTVIVSVSSGLAHVSSMVAVNEEAAHSRVAHGSTRR